MRTSVPGTGGPTVPYFERPGGFVETSADVSVSP
jgi:hypothetical protein